MDIQRYWSAFTTGERAILIISGTLAALLIAGGAIALGTTPFQPAQTDPEGADVVDSNGDGLSDSEERLLYGTDPSELDTSGDGLPDAWLVDHMRTDPQTGLVLPDPTRPSAHLDLNGDGLTLEDEHELGLDPWAEDTSGDGFPDAWLNRSGLDPTERHDPETVCSPDGMTLEEKFEHGLNGCAEATAKNGLTDREEIEGRATIDGRTITFEPTDPAKYSTGGSGLADGFAVAYGLDPHDPNVGRIDHSGDGMSAAEEAQWSIDRFDGDVRQAIAHGLDLTDPDSSDNGIPDAWAIRHGLDPLDPGIADEDPSESGLTNLEEYQWGTDPTKADTSGNGLTDGEEVHGWTITVNGQERHVNSNPLLVDTSGNGLTDYEERHGEVEIDGETVQFPPTDPRLPDTSGDGLTDYQTVHLTFGPDDERLNTTKTDTAGSGLPDGLEYAYWTMRQVAIEQNEWPSPSDIDPPLDIDRSLFEAWSFPEKSTWPQGLEAPTHGECQDQAAAAIDAQDPSALGPGGDLSGDCIPNILSPHAAHNEDNPDMPPGTEPVLDGDQLDPPRRAGVDLPVTDPALKSTSGDALLDAWELRWAQRLTDADGAPAWIPDPTSLDSDADGTLDEKDSYAGKAHVSGTPNCWDDVIDPDWEDPPTGEGVPSLTGDTAIPYTSLDEMEQGTVPLGDRACDTSGDGLNDGWEFAYREHPFLDPMDRLEDPRNGALWQTICYPGPASNPSLPRAEDVARTVDVDSIPQSGDVGPDHPSQLLPPESFHDDPIAVVFPGTGCSWDSNQLHAEPGPTCEDCRIVGVTSTLELQQAYLTDPTTEDTSDDGADDAWKIAWHAVAATQDHRDLVHPAEPHGDDLGDGLTIEETMLEGCSPLVPQTRDDGVQDGASDNCLAPADDPDEIAIRDADKDHQLDAECAEGTPGVYEPEDPARATNAREAKIVEPEPGVFLCEGRVDEEGTSLDADGDGLLDVLERLWTYKSPDFQQPDDGVLGGDASEDGIQDESKLEMGRPSDWPDEQVWWFGADPFQATGLDADGDGLQEALFLDPDPFENLPQDPAPEDAWETACKTGIVCPADEAFSWQSNPQDADLSVEIVEIGEPRGDDRVITKGPEDLDATVEVEQSDGSPAENVPVAFVALTPTEAQDASSGDWVPLGQPERVLCIGTTDSDGTLSTSRCYPASNTTSAELAGTTRSWLSSSTPTWTRSLGDVLDPTDSHTMEASPENQPTIAAWALGDADTVGGLDQAPVLVQSHGQILAEDVPETVPSGATASFTVAALDTGHDPLQSGELTLTTSTHEETIQLDGAPTVTFDEVPLPTVNRSEALTLTFEYQHTPATFIPTFDRSLDTTVLPVPELSINPPDGGAANETVDVDITVTGPQGDPVEGPVTVSLAGVEENVTTSQDGTATATLSLPHDVVPGTSTITARFEGTDSFGPTTAQQDIPINQRIQATVAPTQLELGTEPRFSISIEDLAGRTLDRPAQATLTLGEASDTVEIPAGDALAGLTLPVETGIGSQTLGVTVTTDRNYDPLDTAQPVTVTSTVDAWIPEMTAPRGDTVDLTVHAEDALERPVEQGWVQAEWAYGSTNATLEDGTATIPFNTPEDADVEPVTLTYRVDGPGLAPTEQAAGVRIQATTNVTADATVDPDSGIVDLDVRLVDDQDAPVPAETVTASWPLGEDAILETDAEGVARGTLVIPEDASPGQERVTVSFAGTDTYQASETRLTVPIQGPTYFQVPDRVVWTENSTFTLSGSLVDEDGNPVSLPVHADHGEARLDTAQGPNFEIEVSSEDVDAAVGDARSFTVTLSTPGDDQQAPQDTTILVERLTPVDLTAGVQDTEEGVLVLISAQTPHGPLANAPVGIGHEGGPPVNVTTDEDGRATVHLDEATGTLVARYGGDDAHAAGQATVNLAEPAGPPTSSLFGLAVVGLIALIALDAWIIYRVAQRVRVGRQVEEVLDELEERLVVGDEVQAAVYQAYMRLKSTAEVLGTPEQETETVREFGDRFVNKLGLRSEPVDGLIRIFEKAWYGEATPAMRTETIEELRELQEHLKERGLIA